MSEIYIDLRFQNEWIRDEFPNQDFVSIEDLIGKIEDLQSEKKEIELEYEQFKSDVQDNYKYIPLAEQVDISDMDFI